MLDTTKRYRTRDGSRRDLEIESLKSAPGESWRFRVKGDFRDFRNAYQGDGAYRGDGKTDPRDLIEDMPDVLRLEDFPLVDGKRRGVLRSHMTSEPVVVLCDDAPGGWPLRGYTEAGAGFSRRADGTSADGTYAVLRPAPKSKRKLWVAIAEFPPGARQAVYATCKEDLVRPSSRGRLVSNPVQVEVDDH